MRTTRRKAGFSLIELLTVIAIIAILAGVIFPTMMVVKNRAKTVQCMTNLHDISMALKAFKQDNGYYPDSIGGSVQRDGNSNVIPFEQIKGDALFPEYSKGGSGVKQFHCPLSPIVSTRDVVACTMTLPSGGTVTFERYAYDSYDVYVATPGVTNVGDPEVRYRKDWAQDAGQVDSLYPPHPPGTPATPELAKYDFKRQLKFRFPSDDTVVTWCSYHERVGDPTTKVPVLFLSGTCDTIPANEVNASKWRTNPKRG